MTEPFVHYVVIRFNVPKWTRLSSNDLSCDDEWLRSRVKIFELITLPSLRNQIAKDFSVLILINEDSPTWLVNYFKSLDGSGVALSAIPAVSQEAGMEKASRLVRDKCQKLGVSYSLMTRLDSDDALRNDAIAILQLNFDGQDGTALDFPTIAVLGFPPDEFLDKYRHPCGPFKTIISKVDEDFESNLYFRHSRLGERYRIQAIPGGPYALQYIHGGNVANVRRGFPARDVNLERFGIQHEIKTPYFAQYSKVVVRRIQRLFARR